jgi:hypothetical protein
VMCHISKYSFLALISFRVFSKVGFSLANFTFVLYEIYLTLQLPLPSDFWHLVRKEMVVLQLLYPFFLSIL